MALASDTVAEKVRLCSEALTLVNGASITSFEDNTRGAQMANLHYERVYRSCLTRAKWSFTRTYRHLARDAKYDPKPEDCLPWKYRFLLPTDFIALLGMIFPSSNQSYSIDLAFPGNPMQYGRLDSYSTAYEMRDGFVYANMPTMLIDYQYRLDEDQLNRYPLFRVYFVYSLAAAFSTAVMNDIDRAKLMTEAADEAYHTASAADVNMNPMQQTNYSTTIARMRSFS